MTKADLVKKVSEETGMTRPEVALVIDKFMEAIKISVLDNQKIEIRGFGNFSLKERKKRIARNPKTGEEVIIPDRLVPDFKISKKFRQDVDKKYNS